MDKQNSAVITDIQHFSIHDGPGIRTTVFFKGCPLNCVWCHNPETISPKIEWGVNTETGKKEQIGKKVELGFIFNEILKDKLFYRQDGGVTFSGGEPTQQEDALLKLAQMCKAEGIHVTVDTSCFMKKKTLGKIVEHADLLLCDLKLINNEKHKKYTGHSNELILENIQEIAKSEVPFILRIPLVHEVNDSIEDQIDFIRFFKEMGVGKPVLLEVLPYHSLGEHKYKFLKKDLQLNCPAVPVKTQNDFLERLKNNGINAKISSW